MLQPTRQYLDMNPVLLAVTRRKHFHVSIHAGNGHCKQHRIQVFKLNWTAVN